MGSDETRRRIVFALAVAALVAGVFAMAILDREEVSGQSSAAAPRSGQARDLSEGESRAPQHGAEMRAAAYSARRFVQAYLRYQEGELDGTDRASLLLYATPDLGSQLVRAPVRVPSGSRAPRQFVARVAAVKAGLFDGSPAFLVILAIAGRTGTHLLSTSLIEYEDGWAVAGIGP